MAVSYQKVWDTMNDLERVTSKICSVREILDCAIEAHEYHKREKVEHLLHAVDEYLQYYLQEFDDKFKDAWQATVGDLREGDVKDDGMRPWGHSDLEYHLSNSGIDTPTTPHNYSIDPTGNKVECSIGDTSEYCKKSWNDFWEEDGVSFTGNPNSSPDTIVLGDTYGHSKYYYDYTRNDPTRENPFKDKVIKWKLPVEVDGPSGEYFVNFPDDLLEAADLKEGDQVYWVDNGDGTWMIRKVTKPLGMGEC
jgi:hypothetical protein